MKTLNEKQWDIFNQLLVQIADFDYPTWQQKKDELETNLSESGKSALLEILAWDWEK